MIDAYVILLEDQTEKFLLNDMIKVKCGNVKVNPFTAVTPETIEDDLKLFENFDPKNFKWKWPTDPSEDHLDMQTGLYKFCYSAKSQDKKVACSLSHMLLWDLCVSDDKPIIVFESDARMLRSIDEKDLEMFRGNKVVGLNDPRGATRGASLYHERVSQTIGIQKTPVINRMDDPPYPQGLAGHSAYYIEPEGAKELLDKVETYGMFPNDAYMCRELFPWIRVVYPYYTRISGESSTTTS